MPVTSATQSPLRQVTMPTLAADVVEVTVIRWLKQVGDRVESGEPLVEVSTDKIDVEVPADASGRLCEIRILPGTTVSTGSVIAVIEQSTAFTS